MAFGFAGAAAGANDALVADLVRRRQEAIQQAEITLRQEQAKRQQEQDNFNRQQTLHSNANDKAKIALNYLSPGEITSEQAAPLEGSDYAPAVKKITGLSRRGLAGDLASGTMAETGDAGGQPMTVLQPTKAQEQAAGQQQKLRVITELFKRGAPRNELAAGYADAGENVPTSLLGEDPAAGDARDHANRLEEIRAQGAESRRTAGMRPAAEQGQEWVLRNGKVTPIRKGTAQPGDQPYDAVESRRVSAQTDADTKGRETAGDITRTALDVAQRLATHPGLDKATGAYEMRGFTQDAQDFSALRDQLVSALALPNLGALKGPMSDKDVLFIKSISTRLANPKISGEEERRAISEAQMFLENKLGDVVTLADPKTGTQKRVSRSDPRFQQYLAAGAQEVQ